MFGFLPGPCRGCSPRDEHSAWRSHFCGLCNTLRARYGLWSRWLINRDSTFLALTGSALAMRELEPTSATCCNPLGKKRALVQHHPQMKYAAAVTICGLAVKLRDDAGDEQGLRRHASRAGGWLLRRAVSKARVDLEAAGFPVERVAGTIGGQGAAERSGTGLTDAVQPVARTYGAIFGHMAGLAGTPAGTAALTDAGAALGRMIYTVDAWEDYEADVRRRRFNPLPSSQSLRSEMVAEAVERDLHLLTHSLTALPWQRYGTLIGALSGPMLRRRTLARLGMAEPPPLPPELSPNISSREERRRKREEKKEENNEGDACGCCGRCCNRPMRRRGRSRSWCDDCCDGCSHGCTVCPCDGPCHCH